MIARTEPIEIGNQRGETTKHVVHSIGHVLHQVVSVNIRFVRFVFSRFINCEFCINYLQTNCCQTAQRFTS